MARMRAPIGMSSPRVPAGYPSPSQRSWWLVRSATGPVNGTRRRMFAPTRVWILTRSNSSASAHRAWPECARALPCCRCRAAAPPSGRPGRLHPTTLPLPRASRHIAESDGCVPAYNRPWLRWPAPALRSSPAALPSRDASDPVPPSGVRRRCDNCGRRGRAESRARPASRTSRGPMRPLRPRPARRRSGSSARSR